MNLRVNEKRALITGSTAGLGLRLRGRWPEKSVTGAAVTLFASPPLPACARVCRCKAIESLG